MLTLDQSRGGQLEARSATSWLPGTAWLLLRHQPVNFETLAGRLFDGGGPGLGRAPLAKDDPENLQVMRIVINENEPCRLLMPACSPIERSAA